MSKLFKLKEWLTLDETVNHISSVIGEPITLADIYRFALDGHLKLSANFVNHAKARKVTFLKPEDVEFAKGRYPFPLNSAESLSNGNWIRLEPKLLSIRGLWDLTMLGAEKLDIEHRYQLEVSGVEVKVQSLDGIYLQQGDEICQLQVSISTKPLDGVNGKKTYRNTNLRNLRVQDGRIRAIMERPSPRDNLDEIRRAYQNYENIFYMADSLDDQENVLVVKTKEVTRFIQSLEDSPQEKELTTNEKNSLLVLIAALCNEADVDWNRRGIATALVSMTEVVGAPLSDETIRKILKQIDSAIESRSK
jgi:hypothetical protein